MPVLNWTHPCEWLSERGPIVSVVFFIIVLWFYDVKNQTQSKLGQSSAIEGGGRREEGQAGSAFPNATISRFQTFERLLKAARSSWKKSFIQMVSRPNMPSDRKWGVGPSVHIWAKEHKLNPGVCYLKWLHYLRNGFLLVGVLPTVWCVFLTFKQSNNSGLGPRRHKSDLWK